MSRRGWLGYLLVVATAAAGPTACMSPEALDEGDAGATGGTAGDQTMTPGTGGDQAMGGAGGGQAGGAGGDTPPPPEADAGTGRPSVCNAGPLPPLAEDRSVYASSNLDVWTIAV